LEKEAAKNRKHPWERRAMGTDSDHGDDQWVGVSQGINLSRGVKREKGKIC